MPFSPNAHLLQSRPANAFKRCARLLVVEDNAMNQKVALLMLRNLGYAADTANNGREAIQAIASQPYDLVLMDCRMPEMDGFEATRHIRLSAPRGAQIPIIAITACAFTEDREACLKSGMNDYLAKPVRVHELGAKLEFWLSQPAC
jgi:CheY-like chemotaxis protein